MFRKGLTKENCSSFGFCPNYLPPSSHQFGQLVQLFSAVEIHDLKVSKVKIVKILYTIYIEPKNKFKVQILGILKEIDSFY